MGPTLKPANAQQTATRRKELFLAYETKVFAELRKGRVPVRLVGPLGDRSEIFLGLRLAGETPYNARARIIAKFAEKHPDLCASEDLIDTTI